MLNRKRVMNVCGGRGWILGKMQRRDLRMEVHLLRDVDDELLLLVLLASC